MSLKEEVLSLCRRLKDALTTSAKDKGEVSALKVTLSANKLTLKFFMEQFTARK